MATAPVRSSHRARSTAGASNATGALGDGTTGGPDSCFGGPCSPTPVSVGVSATSLITDGRGFCAILTSSTVDYWGSNDSGDLGIGTTSGPQTCSFNFPCSTKPVSTGVSATSVDSDGEGFCSILTSGAAKCWGNNYNGELGDNTTTTSGAPMSVIGIGP